MNNLNYINIHLSGFNFDNPLLDSYFQLSREEGTRLYNGACISLSGYYYHLNFAQFFLKYFQDGATYWELINVD